MEASKENARLALTKYQMAEDTEEDMNFITEFLQAAEKRLPSAASIARDKGRKKGKAKDAKFAKQYGAK